MTERQFHIQITKKIYNTYTILFPGELKVQWKYEDVLESRFDDDALVFVF